MPGRARSLAARAALEEDEERPLATVGVGDLAREDGDPLAVRPGVVERDGELVLREDESGGAVRGADRRILAAPEETRGLRRRA